MGKAMIIHLVLGILVGGGFGMLLGYLGKCSTGTCPLTANPRRGGLYGMIAGAIVALSVSISKPGADTFALGETTRTAETGSVSPSLRQIGSLVDFENTVLRADLPVLVDFYSDSCPPCRMLGPTIDKIAQSYAGRALVCKVNVNQLPQLAGRYGIRGIPAVLFFVGGDEKNRLVGLQPEAAYTSVLDKLAN